MTSKSVGGRRPMKIPNTVVFSDFLDHAGNPATSVMNTSRPLNIPLNRHPFSFQLYITNGLKYSPTSEPSPLPLTTDTSTKDPAPRAAPSEDKATAEIREFLTNLTYSLRQDSSAGKFCFAIYFMPVGSSPEACMKHYQLEREYRAKTVWPMPETFATLTNSSAVDYRDLLLLFSGCPAEGGLSRFDKNSSHTIQFVVSGDTKVLPRLLRDGFPSYWSEEDKDEFHRELNWQGVRCKTWFTGTYAAQPNELARDRMAFMRLDELANMNDKWTQDDEGEWTEKEMNLIWDLYEAQNQ